MEFKVGEVVVYPHHGAARIADIEQREMRGETLDYLVLQILHSDLEVRVPVKNSELVGVLVVGTLSLTHPELFAHDATVWSGFGYGYFWVPLVLPFVGVWWLVRHRHGIPEPEVPQAVIEGSHW